MEDVYSTLKKLLANSSGRDMLKSIVRKGKPNKDLPDAINLYFSQGISTPEFEQAINRLNIKPSLNTRSMMGSYLGFLVGDAMGTGMEKSLSISHYPVQLSVNVDLLSIAAEMSGEEGTVVLDNYVRLSEGRKDAPGNLTALARKKGKTKTISDAYSSLFSLKITAYWNPPCRETAGGYGGCYARVIPLALSGSVNRQAIDIWLTDPCIEAFQSMHFIITTLRLLYHGNSMERVSQVVYDFIPSIRKMFDTVLASKEAIHYKSDSIYVLATHYALSALIHPLKSVVAICQQSESPESLPVFLGLIYTIAGAKNGIDQMVSDPVFLANVRKLTAEMDGWKSGWENLVNHS